MSSTPATITIHSDRIEITTSPMLTATLSTPDPERAASVAAEELRGAGSQVIVNRPLSAA